tara:strand:- start:1746 stop:1898 length:153 start_codon:yes stop_codon:yes gene_type:complete
MAELIHTDVYVIGGRPGELSVAAEALQIWAKSVLIERGKTVSLSGRCHPL